MAVVESMLAGDVPIGGISNIVTTPFLPTQTTPWRYFSLPEALHRTSALYSPPEPVRDPQFLPQPPNRVPGLLLQWKCKVPVSP